MTHPVEALFGDELYAAWTETIARAALHTLTDEHIRHALCCAENDALTNRRYASIVGDV